MPPITVTATACSSMPSPRSASTEAKRATWMTPATAASAEVIMNRITVTRSTGTPRFRAACAFCPRACTQLPKRVRASRKVPISPMAEEPEHRHPEAEEQRPGHRSP